MQKSKLLPLLRGWCCWRVLEACKPDHVIPCLKPSALAPTACGSSFSVTTPLLTSMPSPRCPSYPECPSPASHLANSSFKTRLRGLLQDALPAPSRLGKMPPVCIFITEFITCPVSWAHTCVCPAPPPLDCASPGEGSAPLSSTSLPNVYQ